MSLKKTPTYCFVIDASIARAAGEFESKHPIGTQCRAFLEKIRGVCHRMAWNDALKMEWEKHESKFAKTWFVSMFSLGKVRRIDDSTVDNFREAIVEHAENEGCAAAITKDAHLVEAALATDHRVASLDETARTHLCRLSGPFDSIRTIHWSNPTLDDECLDWIEAGAPDDDSRTLRQST